MQKVKFKDDWVELKGPFTVIELRGLSSFGHVDKLSVTDQPLLTASVARGFGAVKSVRQLWLRCDVTRTAMRHVISIPGLQVLDVLMVKHPGRLEGFSAAITLEAFSCNLSLNELDLIEVASCRSLREIGAQFSTLTPHALDALLDISGLRSLDLESTNFDDTMAARVSTSRSLQSLDVGVTPLTRKGLEHICRMEHLRSLDIWATGITEPDLDLLADMPNLEYLSVGQVDGDRIFNAKTLLPRLLAIRSLERIWLDGVKLSAADKSKLEERYKSVRITA